MNKLKAIILMVLMGVFTEVLAEGNKDFHSFAPTPPMGWNSWDCYGPSVKERNVYDNAHYMLNHGILDKGWNYIVVDIRWYTDDTGFWYNTSAAYTIDEYGRYMPNTTRFPSSAKGVGFKALADSLHNMGFKFGIHIMRGVPITAVNKKMPILGTNFTCDQIAKRNDSICTWLVDNYSIDCTKPGAQEYYNSLLNLYASWGVDFLKVDDLSRPYHDGEIWLLRNAIDQCGRDIVFNMSPGATALNKWNSCQDNANMWRVMDDMWDNWSDVNKEFSLCANWNKYRLPGSYPDCDMLPFGRIRLTNNDARYSNLTHDEQQTVMTLWSIFKSPLFFAGDFTYNDDWTNALITNEEVIHIDQHSVNNRQVSNDGTKVVWGADEPNSDIRYAALFNIGSSDKWIRYNEALYTSETISPLTTNYGTTVEVDIPQGSKRLALIVDDSGDGYSYDHGDWINPTIVFADGTEQLLTKADMIREDYSGSYFSRINYDKNINGNGKLNINNVEYEHGWSCNANAMVLYKLPENVVKFKGLCGIDNTGRLQTGATPSMKFLVFNDDPTKRDNCNPAYAIANSGLISRTYQKEGVNLEMDITGATKLYLVVTTAGDNFNYDHANWINPTLIDKDGQETKLTSIAYDKSVTDWYNISNYGKNVDGGNLVVNGTYYANGIGTNSNSVITYTLPTDMEFVKFKTFCGFDDGVKNAPNGVTMEFLVFTTDPIGTDSITIPLDLNALGIESSKPCVIYDILKQEEIGTFQDASFTPSIPSHGCGYYRITPTETENISNQECDDSSQKDKRAAIGTFTIEGKRIPQISLPQNQVIIHNGKKMVINTNSR